MALSRARVVADRLGRPPVWVPWAVGRLVGRAGGLECSADPCEEVSPGVAHLGGGCSVTAVEGGRSVRTSMGYTPLEGLMMGTRSGSIDPGVMLRLLADGRLATDGMSDALEHGSGLLGVSGICADMREVEAAATTEMPGPAGHRDVRGPDAGAIASSAAALPRLDGMVFTGGIGEHAGAVRAAIVRGLSVLAVPLVAEEDGGEDAALASEPDRPAVLRIEAREDLIMAAAAERLVGASGPAEDLAMDDDVPAIG